MSTNLSATSNAAAPSDAIHAAMRRIQQDRKSGLDALNRMFRDGRVPDPPPDGPYDGELVAVDIAPGISPFMEWLASLWMPWKGKFLMRSHDKGDNIFASGSRTTMRILFPLYRGSTEYEPESFRAFVFDTSNAAGMVDPDRQVFRIDYDRPDNPALTIRRIVDEIVEVESGAYLGKIHFKWWWGRWQMIGYFALRPRHANEAGHDE